MAGSLGKAYVQIVPSAQGITHALEGVLGGPLKQTGEKLGPTLSSSLGSGLQKIGSGMTNFITKPAIAAAAALTGATVWSGWRRMTEIDNAKVKLQAIGNSAADMEKITVSALTSVKGTAYGMNEAMTSSASAVAAGIKPGEELTKYLTAIADAASVAGVDMSSMGAIFNKVATSGKAQNDVLSQMADAGIPIYQYLADQLGVTAGEVFELAKAGEIGLSDFQEAVTTHIGGAAKEIGSKTITGAISNVKAALSRIGANFLGSADDADSFAGKVLPMLNKLLENMEPIEEKAKELGSQFADAFQKFADAVSKIPLPVLAGIGTALVTVGPALKMVGTAMTLIGPATTALSGVLGGSAAASIMGLVGPLAAVAAGLVLVYTKSESFRNAVAGLVAELGPVFAPILQETVSFLKLLFTELMSVATAVGDALAPAIELLTPVFVKLAQLLGVKIKVSFAILGTAIKVIANAIKAAAAIIQGTLQGIKSIVGPIASAVKKTCGDIAKSFSFSGLAAKVRGVFNAAKEAMKNPVEAAASAIRGIIDKIKGFFHFSVSAPHIPLPHFSISPAGWTVGQLIKGKIPSLSVRWYQKAEEDPYLFRNATLFGAGERNDEILYGRSSLMSDIREAVGGNTRPTVQNFEVNIYGITDIKDAAEEFIRIVRSETGLA